MTDDCAALITALRRPTAYPHAVGYVRVAETHISWVLLTGDYAYKIKKPVDYGFLDFSGLAQRRHYCKEELRLNRRYAPQLYLDVVPIAGNCEAPAVGGDAEPIEYAVKMRQFPEEARLDRVLARGELRREHIAFLAEDLAMFHRAAAVATEDMPYGAAGQVWQPMAENFTQIRPLLQEDETLALLDRMQRWSEERYATLCEALAQRKRDGRIRECHGDAHLANIVLLDDRPVLFDCIEFNPDLRWIDVISEIAFLTMDLHDRGRDDLAHRALNDYMQASGDYAGLTLLRFYQVYRALVRAKVTCLRGAQDGIDEPAREELKQRTAAYLRLALRFTDIAPTPLMITHGLSGSGKTTLTDSVLESQGALRLRSDVERKRLFGFAADARTLSSLDSGLYNQDANARTYRHLALLAETVVDAGFPALVDATFLHREQRDVFRALADRMHVPFVIFDCSAPADVLRERVSTRLAGARDASEATIDVLERQLLQYEPLSEQEAHHILVIQTAK